MASRMRKDQKASVRTRLGHPFESRGTKKERDSSTGGVYIDEPSPRAPSKEFFKTWDAIRSFDKGAARGRKSKKSKVQNKGKK